MDEHDGDLINENIFSHLETESKESRYPKVDVVDLESKSFIRARRFELEPILNPVVFNISALPGQIIGKQV